MLVGSNEELSAVENLRGWLIDGLRGSYIPLSEYLSGRAGRVDITASGIDIES